MCPQSTRASSGPSYPRSAGSPRGEVRRLDLLDKVTDDLARNGLVDFSLRRAARAAGTTHKVLLYYFDGVDDLLRQALLRLRDRRIDNALQAVAGAPGATMSEQIQAILPVLLRNETGLRVIDQAVGLAMYDPPRYGTLAREASRQYMPALISLCPSEWSERRKQEVAEMLLAIFRGFLVELATAADTDGIERAFAAVARALDREQAAPA